MSTARASPEDLRELLHRVSAPRGRPVRGRVLLPRRMTLSRRIDGVWWPRCRELRSELPSVLPVVGQRLRSVDRIALSGSDWTVRGLDAVAAGTVSVEVGLAGTPGRIVFSCGKAEVVFGLIPPEADATTAAELAAYLLPD